jgi:hypothetical protein
MAGEGRIWPVRRAVTEWPVIAQTRRGLWDRRLSGLGPERRRRRPIGVRFTPRPARAACPRCGPRTAAVPAPWSERGAKGCAPPGRGRPRPGLGQLLRAVAAKIAIGTLALRTGSKPRWSMRPTTCPSTILLSRIGSWSTARATAPTMQSAAAKIGANARIVATARVRISPWPQHGPRRARRGAPSPASPRRRWPRSG